MKRETWTQLEEESKMLAARGVHIEPGQLAAVALERGLSLIHVE